LNGAALPAPTATVCLTPCSALLVRLPSFRLRLVGFLVCLSQIAIYVRVWRRRRNFTCLSLGIRSRRQAVLALLLGECLEPCIHLDPQLIVHLLQIVDGDSDRLAASALILFTALDDCVHHVVTVRLVVGAIDHIASGEYAFSSI